MKEEDAREEQGHRLVMYVEKGDKTFGPVQTGAYMSAHYLDDFLEKRAQVAEDCGRRLRDGEISPIAYYMALIEMAEADLASRAGISRRRLRRHLTPAGFGEIRVSELARYAEVFGVPVANLFQELVPAPGRAWRQEKTANPWQTITRTEEDDS